MDAKVKIGIVVILAILGIMLIAGGVVVLAAVIGAYVYGTPTSSIDSSDDTAQYDTSSTYARPYVVPVIGKKTMNGDILITNQGGTDASHLVSVVVSYQPSDADSAIEITDDAALERLASAGGSLTIWKDAGTPDDPADDPVTPTHIIVTGYFDDGEAQVLLDMDV